MTRKQFDALPAKEQFAIYNKWCKDNGLKSCKGSSVTAFLNTLEQEVKSMYVYTFARKTSPYDKTSYEECLAKSEKQAWFYFNRSRGKQWFVRIDSVRLASKDDLNELVEGELKDVTWQ